MRDHKTAVKKAEQVEGLMEPHELRVLADLLPDVPYPRVLETGAWKGRTTTLWHELGATVFTIDNWSGKWAGVENPTYADQVKHLGQFLNTIDPNTPTITPLWCNTITEHADVLTAVRLIFSIRKADLVFIDADHSYEGVLRDLTLAKAAVGLAGVICGHDINIESVEKACTDTYGPGGWEGLNGLLWRKKRQTAPNL